MLMSILLAGAVAAEPCPKGARIVGVFGADAPLYDKTQTEVGRITASKGVVDPPRVIVGCGHRFFFVLDAGRLLAVPKMDVTYDQAIEAPICQSIAVAPTGSSPATAMHAGDPMGCVRPPCQGGGGGAEHSGPYTSLHLDGGCTPQQSKPK